MAKPKKGPAFTIQPKRIAAFDALLGDDVAVADDQMDFLSENSVGSLAFLEKGELNIVDLVEKALEDRSLVPRDLKFDDSAMSVPPNFLEWTTSPTYLKADPYLEQALIGIRLFAEWCPRCSNNEWLHIENHEPQEGIAGIRKNLVLLEHNKCPKCGARRSELLKNGELDFYNELAVNAGQRCVTGATPVVTSGGIKPIHHMFIGHTTPGFHKARLGCAAHNGTRIAQVKQIFISSEEAVKCVVLENGMFIEATDDHPLRCVQGFKHVKNIQAGESVQIVLGTNSWGKVTSPTNIFDAGISTRASALDYLTRNSLGHDTEGTRVYVCDSEQAQMAWSILLNAGFMPDVHRHQHEFYVTFDLTQECRPRSVYLEVLEVHETEPQITYDLLMDGMPQFVAGGFLNHNSGKSVVTAMISTYLTQKILMSQSPTGILGIDPTTMLHGTFVALTQKQASDTLWTPYFQYISQSPWFQQYHEIIRRHERRYGVEVMKIRDTFVMYGHRNLVVYPAGPDGRILRGRTRIFAAIDEVAYFDNDADSKKVKASASMVYGALDRSLATVRSAERKQLASGYDNAFTGYFFNISSPVHARDKINELLRLSFGSKKILGIHAPTWKMNPTMPRDSEFLVEAFRRDPVGAARDYGAEAPMSANPFITQPVFIEKSIREKGRNMVVYQHHYIKFPNGKKQRYGSIVKAATTTRPSIMAIDAGYTNNSFALVVGSRNDNSVISVDCLVEIVPKPGIPLSYNKIFEEIIVPLCRARNVRVLLADQWQSLKLLQDALAACSLDASDQYSLKYRDMWGVKTLLESDPPRISLPRLQHADDIYETLKYDGDEYPWCFEGKPTEHLMMQLQTVQDTGHSVLKNTGATDDLWRAMALMTYGFECTEYDEYLVVKETKAINRDPNRLGTMAGRRNVAQSLSKTVGSMALGSVRTRRIGRN
ncbi:putative terminase [Erwinia phage vB_EamM_Yoloswag]|uniref:Putative terminase n=1 Tax=Erwinia phage vB_EamM_Yoloswag TaxID=1958956 RepID=A0A1S6L2T8_9CAUD|nr:terminase large subunit [Erwinia phage vB_EamM_Yoloswag]AQT28491.1 putative terminase [Erwinia phage vB_EamM_Yoloswag]